MVYGNICSWKGRSGWGTRLRTASGLHDGAGLSVPSRVSGTHHGRCSWRISYGRPWVFNNKRNSPTRKVRWQNAPRGLGYKKCHPEAAHGLDVEEVGSKQTELKAGLDLEKQQHRLEQRLRRWSRKNVPWMVKCPLKMSRPLRGRALT